MNNHDRELLQNRLRVLAQDQGIRLDTPEHWVINGIREPRRFIEHLSLLMGPQSILYIEGTTIHSEAANFYLKQEAMQPVAVACDTAFPVPVFYHLSFSSDVAGGMIELVSRRPIKELLNHIKGHKNGRVIFSFMMLLRGFSAFVTAYRDDRGCVLSSTRSAIFPGAYKASGG